MEYKKLQVPFMERLTFLFTGLLQTKHLIEERGNVWHSTPQQEQKTNINNIEDKDMKMDIPFFDLDNSDTKSNL